MRFEIQGDTLKIQGVTELGASNSGAFRDWVRAAMPDGHKNIEIDLSETTFIDSCGLGALVALQETATDRKGRVRLLNPRPPVQQMLELTRVHNILQVINSLPAEKVSGVQGE